jgi:hypothetical protein
MVELDVPDNEGKKGEILKANLTLNFAINLCIAIMRTLDRPFETPFEKSTTKSIYTRQRSALCRLSAASNPALVICCPPQETPVSHHNSKDLIKRGSLTS